MATDKEETKKAVETTKFIRVHFYLGPVCRSEIFHPDRDFKENKTDILTKFGIGSKLTSEEEKK